MCLTVRERKHMETCFVDAIFATRVDGPEGGAVGCDAALKAVSRRRFREKRFFPQKTNRR